MTNEVRIVVTGENNAGPALRSAQSLADKFYRDQKQSASELASKLAQEGKQAGHKLGEGIAEGGKKGVEDLKRESDSKLDEMGGKFSKSGEESGGGFASGLKGGLAGGAAGILAVGATIAAAAGAAVVMTFRKAIEGAMAAQADNAKLAAQLGLSPKDAARAGKQAGAIYAQNYGESIADVNTAIRAVSNNITDMRKTSDSDLQAMTKSALNLASAFDVDVNDSTRAAGKLMKTGLAKDATEAFDIITRGFQVGNDSSGDWLDTLNEYPVQFQKLGISGQQMAGLISQGLKTGIRDSDIAADAFKEFALRAINGSKATADGFKALGLDATKMANTIAHGGPKAAAAVDLTLDRLRAMKDPVKQAAAATALFGTQSEDAGKALLAMDPSKAVAAIGKVKGAAQDMDKVLGSTWSGKLEAWKRTTEVKLNELGDAFIHGLEDITKSPQFKKFGDSFDKNIGPSLKGFVSLIKNEIMPAIKGTLGDALKSGAKAMESLGKAFHDNEPQIMSIARFLARGMPTAIKMTSFAFNLLVDGISKVITVVGLMKRAFDSSVGAIATVARVAVEAFGRLLDAAVRSLGWIPGLGSKLKSAQKAYKEWAGAALREIDAVANRARGVPSVKPITFKAYLDTRAMTNQLWEWQKSHPLSTHGGQQAAMAHGGIVGAATGGIHGGVRLVGEQGPELVSLPYGSTVHPAGTSREMMRSAGGSGGQVTVRLVVDGDSEFARYIRKIVRVEGGGDVQLAFGR